MSTPDLPARILSCVRSDPPGALRDISRITSDLGGKDDSRAVLTALLALHHTGRVARGTGTDRNRFGRL